MIKTVLVCRAQRRSLIKNRSSSFTNPISLASQRSIKILMIRAQKVKHKVKVINNNE